MLNPVFLRLLFVIFVAVGVVLFALPWMDATTDEWSVFSICVIWMLGINFFIYAGFVLYVITQVNDE